MPPERGKTLVTLPGVLDLTDPETSRARRITVTALAIWAALAVVGRWWLLALWHAGRRLNIEEAAPFVGRADWRPSARLLLPIAVAVVVTIWGPRIAQQCTWRTLLTVAPVTSVGWWVAIAFVDGWHGITRPMLGRDQYLAEVPDVHSVRVFVDTFTERFPDYIVHVQGHPPAFTALLAWLDHIGLGGGRWAAALCLGVGALAVPAVLITARVVVDEAFARRAAIFVVLAPAAIWIATTGDAFFMGVSAWAVALVVLAVERPTRAGDALAALGGLAFGLTAFLSYGLPLLAVIPLVVAVRRRRVRPIAIAAVGAALVFAFFAAAGFWWFEGLGLLQREYFVGVGGRRPYTVFVIVNLSIFAMVLGPAIAVGLARLRDRAAWLLVGGALGAVALADLSGYSKGEVERIWLPFSVWILLAGAPLARTLRSARVWIGTQAAFTILLTTWLRSTW